MSFGQEPSPQEYPTTRPELQRDYSRLETDNDVLNYHLNTKTEYYPITKYIFSTHGDIAASEFNNNKLGFVDKRGRTIIPPIYDLYEPQNTIFIFGHCIVRKDGKFGVINYLNQVIIPFDFELIKSKANGYIVKRNNQYGIFSYTGKEILKSTFDKVDVISSKYATAQKDKNWIIIDNKGNIKLNEELDEIKQTNYSNFYILKKNDKYGLFSIERGMIIPLEYNSIYDRYDMQGFLIEKNQKSNIVDTTGKKILTQDYQSVRYNKLQKTWAVGDYQNLSLLDSTLKEIIPFKFRELYPMCYDNDCKTSLNCYTIFKDSGYGIYNVIEQKFEINPEYDRIEWIKDKTIIVTKNNRKGVMRDGKLAVPIEYLNIRLNSEKNGLVCSNETKNQNFDFERNALLDNDYIKIEKFGSYGDLPLVYTIMKDKKMGLVDRNGVIIVQPQYEAIQRFSVYDNCLLVSQNKKLGLMNLLGEVIEPIQNDAIEVLSNKIKMKKENKWKIAFLNNNFYNSKIIELISTDYLYSEIKSTDDKIGVLLDSKKYIRVKNELVEVQ
jgi:WG containing repeat